MIIIKIIGGLGNQLFQYAAARSLAALRETEVKLDVTGFKDYQLRKFDLTEFQIQATIATDEEIARLKPKGKLQRIQSYITPLGKRRFYKQPYFHFDPRFYKLSSDIYLQGFFQSERYFNPIQSVIRQELQINETLVAPVQSLSNTLQHQPSVALHIRRGDYQNEEILRYHGIVPIDYYHRAVSYFNQQLSNPLFYVFTDDSEWAQENLKLENATIVSGVHTQTHFEDLYLMSCCQHNIIANSSFSWWGAWLNNNPDKIVIAPKQWFNEGPKDTQDLYPANWIKM